MTSSRRLQGDIRVEVKGVRGHQLATSYAPPPPAPPLQIKECEYQPVPTPPPCTTPCRSISSELTRYFLLSPGRSIRSVSTS